MEEELNRRLNNEDYKNWLKVSISLLQAKEALHDFTKDVIRKIHDEICKKTGYSQCDGTCTTNKGKPPTCSSCLLWIKEIKSYNKGLLNWKNTEPTKWHSEPWEIAKCFMNAQGSKTTALLNTGPDKTDLSGILNLLVNCKDFRNCYLKEKCLPERVREIRNKVMHSAQMTCTDVEMKDYLKYIIALLEDENTLKDLEVCKEKVKMIKLLRDGQFEICPEEEVNCIKDVLSSLEQLLESGGKLDSEAHQSLEFLLKFIQRNQDLERKFKSKIASVVENFQNVTDSLDRRIVSCEINDGKIHGMIESLQRKFTHFEKTFGAMALIPSSPTADICEKSVLKNSLQCYVQKKKLALPEYSCVKADTGMFVSTVCVAGREFQSEQPKPTKKAAEQSAAEMALNYFRDESSENSKEEKKKENEPSLSSTQKIVLLPKEQKQKNLSYKNMLQEYAQKQKGTSLPIYDTKPTEAGTFLSSVLFDGRWFTPDAVPKAKKIDAEQDAAQFVLACMEKMKEQLQTPEENSLSCDNDALDSCDSSILEQYSSPKDMKKTYKTILNEHVGPVNYQTIDSGPGKFSCKVEINGKMYECTCLKSSKKESEESAAMIACQQLGFSSVNDYISHSKYNSSATASPASQSCMCNTSTESLLTSLNEHLKSPESDSNMSDPVPELSPPKPMNKKCKSFLNEYCQASGNMDVPKYETTKSENEQYVSCVEVNGKVYASESPKNNKKEAEENAAMMACQELGLSCVQDNYPFSVSPNSFPPKSAPASSTTAVGKTMIQTIENYKSHAMSGGNDFLNEFTASDPAIKLSPQTTCKTYKSLLNEHFQATGKTDSPKYDVTDCDVTRKFASSVYVNGRVYESDEPKSTIKEAKESAAMVACQQLDITDTGTYKYFSVLPTGSGETSDTSATSEILATPRMSATSETSPGTSLMAETSAMSEASAATGIFVTSEKSVKSGTPPTPVAAGIPGTSAFSEISATPGTTITPGTETSCNSSFNPGIKNYRAQLNEYLQTVEGANPPKYEDEPCNLEFLCRLTVLGKTYVSNRPKKTKKEARENAAKVACISLGLECVIGSSFSSGHLNEGAGVLMEDGKLDEFRNSRLTEKPSAVSSTNFKANLAEHVQVSGIVPRYISTKSEHGFRSKVFLGLRCFKGEDATKKKMAEQYAAKAAMEELRNCNRGTAVSDYKNILTKYHTQLGCVDSRFPSYNEATFTEDGKFSVVVNVVKKWSVALSESRLSKKEAEKALAEKAISALKEEGKLIQNIENKNITMQFHEFCQTQKEVPKFKYVTTNVPGGFSGDLCFYTMEQYESLCPQPSRAEADVSAAVSAFNDLDLTLDV